MTHPSKRKARIKEQERNGDETFAKKLRIDDFDDWENDNDSGWDEDVSKTQTLPYWKNQKINIFDKYKPSGSFTKAAKGTANILTLINKHKSIPADFNEVLDDMEIDKLNYMSLNLKERIENLKVELKEKQKSLTAVYR
ncbi:11808_t:CDS:2 [Funneliformis geosporum]|uniref:11808_t:CDS:1 n=1 Tax=Funneliformis geosporum TaxID=1117311 RepID=A0A9W4T4G3_9GLOM|nr:11808_t:CDS:2 [Funneliformis geosporum]